MVETKAPNVNSAVTVTIGIDCWVGTMEGAMVGCTDGDIVGKKVGSVDGLRVGTSK